MAGRVPVSARVPWRTAVLVAVGLAVSSCGGMGSAGMGQISGTVSVSVALTAAKAAPPSPVYRSTVMRAPTGLPSAVPDEVLVKFKPGIVAEAAAIHRQAGAVELQQMRRTGIRLVRIAPGENLAAVLTRYRSDPRVAYAEPNYYRHLDAEPNDPLYPQQWNFTNIGMQSAWNVTTGSALVVVAVIDAGLLPHPDLAGVTVPGYDFVDNDSDPTPSCPDAVSNGHGTHVAGIIAAATNNAQGVAGVNWGGGGRTRIMPLRIMSTVNSDCLTTSARIVNAIEYAADHSARVINMSFGAPRNPDGTYPPLSQAEQDAVTYAHNTGVVLIASAGNNNLDCSQRWVVAYTHVIGVAATTMANNKASYSNFGSCIDVAAPGGDATDGVLSTWGADADLYKAVGGTSFAAAHVSGLAALLIAKGVTGPATIQSVLQSTAVDLGAPGFDTTFGAGLIDAAAAVGAPAAIHPMRVFGGTISGNTITRASAMVTVSSTGAYTLSIPSGTWTVFAWQDTNGSGTVDAGDLYGAVHGVSVTPGATSGGSVAVTEVPLGTPPRTVAGTGAAAP